MGQWWHVIALDRREKLASHFRTEELLNDASGLDLVVPLAVPIVSQSFGVTQAPDATASDLIKPIPINRGGPEPSEKEQRRPNPALSDISVVPVINSTCGLSSLSNELLDMIFENLDIEQVFVLGLQGQNYWNVARRHIQAYLMSPCGSWAGTRIICGGDDSEWGDYPSKVLTESEEAELEVGLSESIFGDDVTSYRINLFGFADARYQTAKEWQSHLVTYLIGHAAELGEWHRLPDFSRSRIRDDLRKCKLSDLYPEDQSWVLRNLTTQEYVRSEAIAIKPEHIHGPNIEFFGFGQVVCSRICWSTAGTLRDDTSGDDINRGVWAGHRFDITTLDRLNQGFVEGTEWTDVSEEVMNEIDRLLSQMDGSNWRESL